MPDYEMDIQKTIKDGLDTWLDELKEKHPQLLLTRQWQVLFPRGYRQGLNCLPVVTDSKQGKHLIAEVHFVLPANLELDLEHLDLVLKDEAFQTRNEQEPGPPALDRSLDQLNRVVCGINQFLMGLPVPAKYPHRSLTDLSSSSKPDPSHSPLHIKRETSLPETVSEVQALLAGHKDLPEWLQMIRNPQIKEQVLKTMAEGYLHYRQHNADITLQKFFELYNEHLRAQGKLYAYCRYKAQPVHLDSYNRCQEAFCSRKPGQGSCAQATWRFGSHNNEREPL